MIGRLAFTTFALFTALSLQAQECMIGEVKMFAGNFAPRGWALAQGQTLPIAQNTALFSILGTQFGGDGRTTFQLPDLRGRVAVGTGAGPGLQQYQIGMRGGNESFTLTQVNLPAFSSVVQVNSVQVTGQVSVKEAPARGATQVSQVSTVTTPVTLQFPGNSMPIFSRDPYTSLSYIICLQGIYPSRD